MPVFNEDVTVNGLLHIRREGDGSVVLHLSTERHWELRQFGVGKDTALELASVGGANPGEPIASKNFIINTHGRVGIGTTSPQATLDVEGSIRVADDVILAGADCAEDFDLEEGSIEDPGTVLVLGSERRLQHCSKPYDTRAIGVVAGANDQRPGIILGRHRHNPAQNRVPVALTGTVWCRADATEGAIDPGDLLTTAARPGHAMRASDPIRSFGAIIGKALTGLPSGLGLIPILAIHH